MSQRCDLCRRGAKSGNNVSHSNVKTKRLFRVNLVMKRIAQTPGGALERLRVCTRCLKTQTKRAMA